MADNPFDISNVQTTYDDAGRPTYSLLGDSVTAPYHISSPFKPSLINDSENNEISSLARELGMNLNNDTIDYLTEYYLNEKGAQNAYAREMYASNTQYQRAVEDMKKAGLNPFLAFDSLRGGSVSSSASSVSGGLMTSRKNSERSAKSNMTASAIAVLGLIASAMIRLFK